VVQRQLWLLENIPDITIPQAYDLARKEFYKLRRAEETRDRIAAEEARHMGAQFGPSYNKISMKIENEMFNKWEVWARGQLLEQVQRTAAFEGTAGMAKEETALQETAVEDGGYVEHPNRSRIGSAVFAGEDRHQRRTNAPSAGDNVI
jgi:small subunit ribosomal protein S23